MAELNAVLAAPVGFSYDPAPQRTAPWYQRRLGKRSASRLADWLAVSKAKNGAGKPLKSRLDYEKELLFEQKFGVAYENFVSSAMQDGIDFEAFARRQYMVQYPKRRVYEVGCWYNEFFVASPDSGVDDDGLLEIKVVRENTFSDILTGGVPDKWWKQIQGQLWASGRKWCDFVAINLKTKKVKIIRVFPDAEFHEWLAIAVPEPITQEISIFDDTNLFDFKDVTVEEQFAIAKVDELEFNF